MPVGVETSLYQHLKIWLIPHLGLSKDAIHIYIGFACLLIALLVLRQPLSSLRVLVPGLVVTVIMETLDLRDDFAAFARLRWSASLKDALNTNAIPTLLVLMAKLRWLGRGAPRAADDET